MRRRLAAAVSVAVMFAVTGFAVTGDAGVRRQAYRVSRQEAVKQVGRDAPGRDIVRYGTRSGKAPTKRQLKESIAVLKRMADPAPTLVPVADVQRDTSESTTTTTETSYSGGGSCAGGPTPIPCSIIMCESGGSYTARNASGAYGRYQIMPGTAAAHGCSLATPAGQDACAAKIYAGGAGRGNWVC